MRFGALVAAAATVLLSAGSAAADVPPVPGPVTAWLETEGRLAVLTSTSPLTAEQLDAVAIGPATNVQTWSEDYAAGEAWDAAAVPTDEWAAPVLLEERGVGAIVVTEDDSGAVSGNRVLWNADLGADLAAFRATTFILDDATGGWFRLGGDILTPVTEEARDVLAGSIDITEYQRYLVERLGGGGEEPESPVQPEPANLSPVLVAASALGALLVLVGVTVWVRRPDDLED